MIKIFCDVCKQELNSENPKMDSVEGVLNAHGRQIYIKMADDTSADVCFLCALDSLKRHDFRPVEGAPK